MGKWFGTIGYAVTTEIEPGIWEPRIVERQYYGDTVRNLNRKIQNSGGVNDNVILTNSISILADPFASDNFCNMRYLEFMGTKWKIEDVEVQYPRLILTMGGVYNGQQASTAE